MVFVQFFIKDLKDTDIEACGSDGVFILDERNKLIIMKNDAKKRIAQLSKIHQFSGYEIRKGERFEKYKVVYRSKTLDLNK